MEVSGFDILPTDVDQPEMEEKRTLRVVPPPNCRETGQARMGSWLRVGGYPLVFAFLLYPYESKWHSVVARSGASGKHMIPEGLS